MAVMGAEQVGEDDRHLRERYDWVPPPLLCMSERTAGL